jgi:hypothetical protein
MIRHTALGVVGLLASLILGAAALAGQVASGLPPGSADTVHPGL